MLDTAIAVFITVVILAVPYLLWNGGKKRSSSSSILGGGGGTTDKTDTGNTSKDEPEEM